LLVGMAPWFSELVSKPSMTEVEPQAVPNASRYT
jgi:hypothetical protein